MGGLSNSRKGGKGGKGAHNVTPTSIQSPVELFILPDLFWVRFLDCRSNPQSATVCRVPSATLRPGGQADKSGVLCDTDDN